MRLLLLLALVSVRFPAFGQDDSPAARGHVTAALFYEGPGVRYFLTKIPTTTPNFLDYAIVAMHAAPPTESALLAPVERVVVTDRQGQSSPGVRYSAALMADFTQNVFPALSRRHPELSRMIRAEILHYIQGLRFTDLPYFAGNRTRRTPRIEYEQPAFTTMLERAGAGAPWAPGYEKYGMAGDSDPESFFTVAELRKARVATDRSVVEIALTPAQREAKEHTERQFAAAVARERQARRPGIVYKQARFWKPFAGLDVMRAVFGGGGASYATVTSLTDTEQIARVGRFQTTFVSFVDLYSSRCTTPLPPGFTILGAWRKGEAGNGEPEYRIYVDRRFKDKYIQYAQSVKAQVGAMVIDVFKEELRQKNPSLANAAMRTLARGLEDVAAWNLFFDKVPCQSATMRQLGENLLLASLGLPSLQQGGGPPPTPAQVTAAARESEAFTREDWEADGDPADASFRMMTALAQEKQGRGLPLAREDLMTFRHFRITPDLPYRGAVFAPLAAIERAAPNVMKCAYGPVEVTKAGLPLYRSVYFWYRQIPPEWPAVLAADTAGKVPRSLQQALAACPLTNVGLP